MDQLIESKEADMISSSTNYKATLLIVVAFLNKFYQTAQGVHIDISATSNNKESIGVGSRLLSSFLLQ